jgi:cellobiose transport system permease protein
VTALEVRRRSRRHRFDRRVSPYLYVLPFFLLFGLFGAFPLLYTVWVSLFDWDFLAETHTFIGLDNYTRLAGDHTFWNAVANTAQIMVLATVPQLALALLLAYALNQGVKGGTFWRMSVLLPNVTSVVAVTIVFGQLFGRDYGLVNWLLGVFDLGKIDWQAGEASSQVAIAVMIVWRWTGYTALIYLAAMQAVPRDLYAAAALDGATRFQQFRKITVPAIRPTIIFTVVVATIAGMQVLAEPLLFGGGSLTGGSDRQFQTLSLYLYEVGFSRWEFGYASAASWATFALILLAAILAYLLVSRLRRR